MTPEQRHRGEELEILAERRKLYVKAREKRPERRVRPHALLEGDRLRLAKPGTA